MMKAWSIKWFTSLIIAVTHLQLHTHSYTHAPSFPHSMLHPVCHNLCGLSISVSWQLWLMPTFYLNVPHNLPCDYWFRSYAAHILFLVLFNCDAYSQSRYTVIVWHSEAFTNNMLCIFDTNRVKIAWLSTKISFMGSNYVTMWRLNMKLNVTLKPNAICGFT